ncbi:MAG: hydroxyacid dehydrogenase [Proteobacteria bacterium]|nr:hydroxyacid dehydrogenase [Pseudomonadota bacterium]
MLILLADAFDPSLPERLKAFGEVTDDVARLAEAEVLLIRSKTKATGEYLARAPQLKLIIRGGVGLDNVDRAYAKERGIRVDNTPDASTVAVAEFALTLMLAAINHVIEGHNGMLQGKFLKKELKRSELFGKTLGLIGVGRIGTAVAQRAKAFGMRVVGYDPFVQHNAQVELLELDAVLSGADLLSLHAPLTPETRGLLNGERLGRTKRGVVIVNTGRGGCVDEPALAAALQSGQVRCYATDVWSSDPPPTDCPLVGLPGVLMAPHIGASSKENLLRIGDEVVQKIAAYSRERG